MFDSPNSTPVQFLGQFDNHIQLYVKREDQIHPYVSGNKWRKLKYNFHEAIRLGHTKLITFGGAFSNHIHATAAAGFHCGLETIGMIRGEIVQPYNPTLQQAAEWGMRLIPVEREQYRRKEDPEYLKGLQKRFGSAYIIPEGGANTLAVKGVSEMTEISEKFDYWCLSCGTGATMAGAISGLTSHNTVLGFPALKGGEYLRESIGKLVEQSGADQPARWDLITDYHFGGYAKINDELIKFILKFKSIHNIQLDPIYTGKLFFGVFDLIKSGFFPTKSKVLMVHSGGLQGIAGIEKKYGFKLK